MRKKYLIYTFGIAFIILMLLSSCSNNNNVTQTEFLNSSENTSQSVNNEPTEKETAYTPLLQLGSDLTSFNIEIEGDIYHLPAPISAFLDNGWEITGKTVDTIEANDYKTSAVSITKNNKTLSDIDLNNYSNEVKPVEQCFVYGITAKKYTFWGESDDIAVILPDGVTIGTSENEVTEKYKSLLDNGELKTRIDNNDYILYEYVGIYNHTIQIYINKETKLVYNIMIQNLEN
ncbi:MAG: hypothetical protein FWD71_00085 [Oscillospiraceae bacterium]|nr:hypothetical protein [Oscillospiraceae bacterium]